MQHNTSSINLIDRNFRAIDQTPCTCVCRFFCLLSSLWLHCGPINLSAFRIAGPAKSGYHTQMWQTTSGQYSSTARKALKVHELQDITGGCNNQEFIKYVKSNTIHTCPITNEDIKRAENIILDPWKANLPDILQNMFNLNGTICLGIDWKIMETWQ